MKKVIYIIVVMFLPMIILSQQTTDLRSNLNKNECKDSVVEKLFPIIEKWRLDYNRKGTTQLSAFDFDNTKYIPSNMSGYFLEGKASYTAIFYKEINSNWNKDSTLILSINYTCDEAILFTRPLGDASSQVDEDFNIMNLKKVDGLWLAINHFEAIKD